MQQKRIYRRRGAADYLKQNYGEGNERTLAKLAVVGGGPEFFKCGRTVLYYEDSLDNYGQSRIRGPFKSTSDTGVE